MHKSADSLLPRRFPGGCLRRLHASDLGPFQAYRNIPDLGRYQGWAAMSEAEALAFLVGMEAAPLFQPGTWVQLGIADSDTGGLVGDVGILLQADTQTAEVGFTLAPAAQGQGVATLAVREALQMLFTATSVWQVLGITDARNSRSIRLLERLGFKCRASRSAVFRGEECTDLVFVLPRETANPDALADNHPRRDEP